MSARLALLLLCALVVGGCKDRAPKTPEEAVLSRIAEGVRALDQRDVKAAGALLHEGYSDESGRDRQRMKALAFAVLRRGPVKVAVREQRVELLDEDRARVRMEVVAVQADGAPSTVSDLVPRGRAVEVTVDLLREGERWLVTAIDGDGVGGVPFGDTP